MNDLTELKTGLHFFPLPGRSHLEITGADRASFLHNLCTNEVRKLAVGQGCEAFFCNVHGKTLAHSLLYCGPTSIALESVPGAAERLANHLERYHIREAVEIFDRTSAWHETLLVGTGVSTAFGSFGIQKLPPGDLGHTTTEIDGRAVQLRRLPLVAEGWAVVCAADDWDAVRRTIEQAGGVPMNPAAFEQARIEAGWPWYGVDISEQNLAPEVGRDAQAISYTKGCYLGQETIARIDALGHVNRSLVGVLFTGTEIPSAGLALAHAGQEVGQVTSAAWSPKRSAPLALAYVRRGSCQAGAELSSPLGPATVISLPV